MKRSSFFRIFGVLLLGVTLTATVLADTIRLKDGSLIKGKIVTFADGKFVVAIGEGSRRRELTFNAAEIASISFDSPANNGEAMRTSNSNSGSGIIVPISTRPAPKVVVTDPGGSTAAVKKQERVPTRSTPPVVNPTNTVNNRPVSGSGVKPIELNVKVLSDNTANGWSNSGWIVKKGQRIRITGSGTVSLGKGQSSPPSGLSEIEDDQKLLKSVPTGALLAVIGDDNNDFIYVGAEREFTAARDGALYLGVNEGNLSDNSGAYEVKVEILPQ